MASNVYVVLLESNLYVARLQRFWTSFTNGCIYIVVDPSNATNNNTYKSVGVDLSNAYIDKRQHIDALLKGGSCCSGDGST